MIEPAQQTPPAAPPAGEVIPPVIGDPRRFAFTGSLRNRAARGVVINAGFTVAAGLLAMVKGFILAGFLSRSDYGVWGVVVAMVYWVDVRPALKEVSGGNRKSGGNQGPYGPW